MLALVLTALAWPRAAHAGHGLFKCQGARGETVFTSAPAGYRGCKRVHLDEQAPINGRLGARPSAVKAPAPRQASAASTPAPKTDHRSHLTMAEGAQLTSAAKAAQLERAGKRVLRGAVYRVVHADGSVEYTNVRPHGARGQRVKTLFTYIATCPACEVHSPINWRTVPLHMTAYAHDVQAAASEYGVSAALLRAVIHAESAFNPRAVSNKGAQGLMQLMPGTASDMGVNDAFNAAQNIRGGARYLASLLKTFNGNVRLAAAAYNAGPAAVQKYGGVPPYDQTQVYVDRVDILRKRYAAAQGATALAVSSGSAG
ncbi:lytic transglycosylase domain-containing protein [Oleiagrimonas sp. C23AA]|uniref:lytic transglycosylase domain-containing protein n=1 Tax=Oleiagrimonas sp. C23AA TaxID=2719047 RepID=UPI0031B6B1BD